MKKLVCATLASAVLLAGSASPASAEGGKELAKGAIRTATKVGKLLSRAVPVLAVLFYAHDAYEIYSEVKKGSRDRN